jgi:hypothetical protein
LESFEKNEPNVVILPIPYDFLTCEPYLNANDEFVHRPFFHADGEVHFYH